MCTANQTETAPHMVNQTNVLGATLLATKTTIKPGNNRSLMMISDCFVRGPIPTKAEFKTGSGGSGIGSSGGLIVGGGGGVRCGSGGKLVHQLTGGSANDDEGYEESLYFQPTRTLRKDQQQIYHNSGSK